MGKNLTTQSIGIRPTTNTGDPRYSSELKYKAYHLSLVTIETILKRNLPFLFPFVVESELRSIDEASTSRATGLMLSLQKQIDEHEVELTEMIDALTAEQMESLRTTIEYLWGKSYSKDMFNKSTAFLKRPSQPNLSRKARCPKSAYLKIIFSIGFGIFGPSVLDKY